jgi:hypothetical protein
MQIPALLVCVTGLALAVPGATPPAPRAAQAPARPAAQDAVKQAPPSQKAPVRRGRGSGSGGVQPDAAIEAAIRAKFAKSKIGADKFTVRVQGGVATLEGQTDVAQHKGVATRLARTGGAVAVDNRIQISEAARAKAAANLEKGRRRAQIKRGETRSQDRSQGAPR